MPPSVDVERMREIGAGRGLHRARRPRSLLPARDQDLVALAGQAVGGEAAIARLRDPQQAGAGPAVRPRRARDQRLAELARLERPTRLDELREAQRPAAERDVLEGELASLVEEVADVDDVG